MRQEELEKKVTELFERQGFRVEKDGNSLAAVNGKELMLEVFSSENYSKDDVVGNASGEANVFVDETLAGVKDLLENDVSVIYEEKEESKFNTPSYELIGDIAVINDLAGVDREEAVKGIRQHQSVKTILLKKEGLKGEFRVGDYEKLFGDETETIHREFGCRFKVDPTKTYFSERFSTERKRVVDQIEDGENALVMFAGVGPFAIMAAKLSNPKKVISVEKNPEAARYLKENIEINGVEDIVDGIDGDVSDVVPELGKFDRVIMPLPGSSQNFLPLALEHTLEEGVVHYYRFLEDENWDELEDEIVSSAEKTGSSFTILDRTVTGERGPSVSRVCLDIRKG